MQITLEGIGVAAGVIGAIAGVWQLLKRQEAVRSQSVKTKNNSGNVSVGDVYAANGGVAAGSGSTVNIVHKEKGQADEMKRRDLRLELRKTDVDVRLALTNLRTLMEKADNSRQRVLAATGQFRSGTMELWTKELAEDAATLDSLNMRLPALDQTYDALDLAELEEKLIEVHTIQSHAQQLTSKCQSALAADDIARQQIHAANHHPR